MATSAAPAANEADNCSPCFGKGAGDALVVNHQANKKFAGLNRPAEKARLRYLAVACMLVTSSGARTRRLLS